VNKWLEEVKESLADALDKAERGDIPQQNIYMLAPIFYSEKHNIKNEALIQEMINANDEQVASDWALDKKSKFQYKFHYVSSYLYCFVVAGKIDELKYDQIMDYVNGELDLFAEDYGQ
jgi:hypothetical protein